MWKLTSGADVVVLSVPAVKDLADVKGHSLGDSLEDLGIHPACRAAAGVFHSSC